MTKTEDVRIYVASLTDYNNGFLHGAWIDVNGKTEEDIYEEINDILKCSPSVKKWPDEVAEEFAIHDYEAPFKIDEYDSIKEIVELTEAIESHGIALLLYHDHIGNSDIQESIDSFDDAYCGEYNSEDDYAYDLFQECFMHDVPESIQYYIDYDKFTRDLFMSDNFSISSGEGTFFIFRSY